MKSIRLESKEVLDFITFTLQVGLLTTYNNYLIKEKDKRSFFSIVLLLQEYPIPFTTKDLLWKEWEAAWPYKDGRCMGINTFANWLEDLQIKVIAKDGNQCILQGVK